jgi:lipoprotein-anchoring transpeptidase ErfK/SrfK
MVICAKKFEEKDGRVGLMQAFRLKPYKIIYILVIPAVLCLVFIGGSPALNGHQVNGTGYLQTATPTTDYFEQVYPFQGYSITQDRQYSRVMFGRTGEELENDGPVRWIDVDLGEQIVYAYENNSAVRRFIASTGTRNSPTIIGQFRAYEFHDSTYMIGEGFYFPSVKYVIYFYKGYSFHAADWHDNFGEPMSHGCINMREEDAAWLFDWAGIGTLVNIHY